MRSSIVGISAAAPRPLTASIAKNELRNELDSYLQKNLKNPYVPRFLLNDRIKFIGSRVQFYMPTTEPSKNYNKDVYFRSHADIATFQETHKGQHLQDFKDLCIFFGINCENTEDRKVPLKFEFLLEDNAQAQFKASNKDFYKVISRMIESVCLVQGMPEALCFSKFLCESFPKDGIENKDLAIARQFWLTAWAPRVQRHPGGEVLQKINPAKIRAGWAVRPVQEVFNLCCNFEDLKEIFERADNNLISSRRDGDAAVESPQLPAYVTDTVYIGEKTQVHCAACTSVVAIRDFTKAFGSELGVLNFANAYRVAGGVLGFGRVQEEGLFQRTTMFSITLEEMMRGEVQFLPEHRTLGRTMATIFHEGEYTRQLEYIENRTKEIEGRADHGFIVQNPNELIENYRAVIIKDDDCRELKAEDQMPFVVLTAALSDRSRTAAAASKTPSELAATVNAPGANTPYSDEEMESIKSTLAAILRTAEAAALENLVLGAIGCGAFGHIPETIASIFKNLLSDEFKNKFKHVVFAIPGVTSRNFTAFQSVFTGQQAKEGLVVEHDAELTTGPNAE